MNNLWNVIANIGVRATDTQDLMRWKRLQNQLFLVVIPIYIAFSVVGIMLSPEVMIWRGFLFTAFLFVCMGLNALNLFEISRMIFILLSIPIFFLPNWIFKTPVHFPLLALNSLFIIILQYITISYLLPKQDSDKFKKLYLGVFLILYAGDFLYLPFLHELAIGSTFLINDIYSYFAVKSLFTAVILLQLFTLSYVNSLIKGLLYANKKLDASIEEKVNSLMKQIDSQNKERLRP